MTTKEQFLNFDYIPAVKKYTLEGLNQPADLFKLLYKRKFGLGIVAGTDLMEIRKTLFAVANAFEGYRFSIELRSEASEPLPGVTSLNVDHYTLGADRIMKNGHNDHLIIMDSVDTPEKLEMAVNYASAGGMIIAPVISVSMEKTLDMLCESGRVIAPYSFAHSFTYFAQQNVVVDPSAPHEEAPVVVTQLKAVDVSMRNDLAAKRG